MKKLLLINPVGRRSGYLLSRFSTFPPLGLAYVAAATPETWQVEIVDENFDPWEFKTADLVGLTAFTSSVNRAYEIAQAYRLKGIPVVMGGIHASMEPHEALQFVDSVIIGEAEDIWAKVIADFEADSLAATYQGPQVDLERTSIAPRRDLLHSGYFWQPVLTSRGCPFACNFCSVSRHMGKKYRQRGVTDVLHELEGLPGRYVTFLDDNLIGYSAASQNRAKQLFTKMIERGLNKRWWMQTSVNAVDDENVIELAAKAGCMFALIGFETTNHDTLKEMGKCVNIEEGRSNYKRVAATFHKYGIAVLGTFIIGNDNERTEHFQAMADYLSASDIDVFQITVLTPLPGTDLMQKMKDEARLVRTDFPKDWNEYRFTRVVHELKGTDEATIYAGKEHLKQQLYSWPAIGQRLLKSLRWTKSPLKIYAIYQHNMMFRNSWLKARRGTTA